MNKKKTFNKLIVIDIIFTLLFIMILPMQIPIRIDNTGNVMYGNKLVNFVWIIVLVLISVFINNLAKMCSDKKHTIYKIGMSIAILWGGIICGFGCLCLAVIC